MSKSVISGKKFNGNHQTFIPEAEILLAVAKDMTSVSKIVIGPIKKLRVAKRSIKQKPINAGLEVIVRGGNARQIFYIYTKKPSAVWDILEKKYVDKYS